MWVLIIIFYVLGEHPSTSVAMHDFTTQAACEKAKDLAATGEHGYIHLTALCTPK